jgi:hypothetical protein
VKDKLFIFCHGLSLILIFFKIIIEYLGINGHFEKWEDERRAREDLLHVISTIFMEIIFVNVW